MKLTKIINIEKCGKDEFEKITKTFKKNKNLEFDCRIGGGLDGNIYLCKNSCNSVAKVTFELDRFKNECINHLRMNKLGVGPEIYDIFYEKGKGVIVMEKYNKSMNRYYSRYIRDGVMNPVMLEQLYTEIRTMHNHGYVHMDIHPGNLLFKDDKVTITDFSRMCTMHDAKNFDRDELELMIIQYESDESPNVNIQFLSFFSFYFKNINGKLRFFVNTPQLLDYIMIHNIAHAMYFETQGENDIVTNVFANVVKDVKAFLLSLKEKAQRETDRINKIEI